MRKVYFFIWLGFIVLRGFSPCFAQEQEEKLHKLRAAGGAGSATQMPLWFAKEARLFEKYGISAEVITIPGSSLLVQSMLAGEVAIGQIGGPAPVLATLSGGDLVIIATIVQNFVFSLFSRPEINRIEELKSKVLGVTRLGTLSDFAARFALQRHGLEPGRDVIIIQTGGQAETVAALSTGKIQAAALTAPGNVFARKLGFKELFDISKLEANFHVNGVATTRRYLRTSEDIVTRFLKAYIEGVALAKKDKAFALKTMAKYLRTEDKEILGESYEWVIRQNLTLTPYPAVKGVATILQSVQKQYPQAKTASPGDFVDGRLVKELDEGGFIKSLLP